MYSLYLNTNLHTISICVLCKDARIVNIYTGISILYVHTVYRNYCIGWVLYWDNLSFSLVVYQIYFCRITQSMLTKNVQWDITIIPRHSLIKYVTGILYTVRYSFSTVWDAAKKMFVGHFDSHPLFHKPYTVQYA